MKIFLTFLAAFTIFIPFNAHALERFVTKLKLPTGQTAVVAEGDFEARSIGSFSVRLYASAAAPDETTFFTSGLVHSRDGVIEKVMLDDLDGDQQAEILVVARSAGTGSYLSVYAFAIEGDRLFFRAAMEGLPKDADPAETVRENLKKK